MPDGLPGDAARVAVKTLLVSLKEFAPSSLFAAGTRTSLKVMSACQTARLPILPLMRSAA